MKCPRCSNQLKRVQVEPHKFIYRCQVCGLEIGNKRREELDVDEPKEERKDV